MPRAVLHVDLDEFVAAVEVMRRPALRDQPVVVGGMRKRGVVATANYVARAYGIRSGMPVRVAARRCPTAVFLPVDREACEAASRRVIGVLERFAVALEAWGWDEAFLEVDGDAETVAHDIRRAVASETGLSCSVGIGDNKLRAKTAAGLAKPGGIYRLDAGGWLDVMGARSTRELWGVGPKTARRLAGAGIATVRELADSDAGALAEVLGGRSGPSLVALARGEHDSPVDPTPRRARSRSFELTFDEDVEEGAVIRAEIDRMARELARYATSVDRAVTAITVKLRFAPFVTKTRSRRLEQATVDVDAILAAAWIALSRFELGRPVRLVGVKADLL